jgi:acetylornithine deacetylase/succinyl-diaminopimelate desuccinylase-like protein
MDKVRLTRLIGESWDREVVPALTDYIRIPNKSPAFDPDWAAHGHMDRAVALLESWARARLDRLAGARLEVVRLPGRTPVILVEVPGLGAETVLLYGHLDKQPEMSGWLEGTGPWSPRLEGDRLYGRGGADDGYAMFGALAALLALADQKIPHARCVLLIEASEESGSPDLPHYVDHLADRLGPVSLVICLDSGCGDYERMWMTTSLRGLVGGTLAISVLEEGVHSGYASGIVPSSFRILRQLLSRLEEEATGRVLPKEFWAEIPQERVRQAGEVASVLGAEIHTQFPFAGGTRPVSPDPAELILNRTWRPQLALTGMAGLPPPADAGNVLLPGTIAKLSLRLPPTVAGARAASALKALLEADPPYGASIRFTPEGSATGWNAPALAPWLEQAVARAAQEAFGLPPAYVGEGGTIPFMGMLGEKFPAAQFVITGVLGPHSNAHGPNEFLHIPTGKRISVAVAHILAEHARRAG